ncbi:MAG: hypothetical protein AAF556_12250 [Pseudomonadota bacterium]
MNPLLSPNLTNALADSVIDAAKAAGLPVPGSINRLHSKGSPHAANPWHQAMGATNRDNVVAASSRRHALSSLNELNEWATSLLKSAGFQTALTHEKQQQARAKAAASTKMVEGMDVAVAIDDALKPHVLEQVFEEPDIARGNIKADLDKTHDPSSVIAQLERTPDVYGEVLGTRRFGVNSGTRHNALLAVRDLMVKPIRAALGETSQSAPQGRPMQLPDPSAEIRVNHHLLAFETNATKFTTAHAELMRTDIERDIREQPVSGYWAGHGGPPKRAPGA